MIREIAAALGGVTLAVAAFLIALTYPGMSNSTATNTGFYRQLPIASPIYGSANQTPRILGVSGIYSGILPALILVLLAVGSGIIVFHVGRARLKRDEVS